MQAVTPRQAGRSEEHTSELQSRENLVCRLLLEKKKGGRLQPLCEDDDAEQKGGHRDAGKARSALCDGGSQHCNFCFFFNDTATTEIYTLSLHDALPISAG